MHRYFALKVPIKCLILFLAGNLLSFQVSILSDKIIHLRKVSAFRHFTFDLEAGKLMLFDISLSTWKQENFQDPTINHSHLTKSNGYSPLSNAGQFEISEVSASNLSLYWSRWNYTYANEPFDRCCEKKK